jgi:hypothetical protein
MPILDFDSELECLLDAIAEQEEHVKFVREHVFLGIGDQGSKFIHDFYRSWGKDLNSSEFLVIESSDESGQLARANGARPAARMQHRSTPVDVHRLPESPSRHLGYHGLGERLAASDPFLDDQLRRSGIRPSTTKQTVFVLTALGGGTGSGASPHAVQRTKVINPRCRSLVASVMPTADESDGAHFNAFCSLARFLEPDGIPDADMILLMDHERLMEVRGVGSAGEELSGESLLSHMIAVIMGAIGDRSSTEADPSYLAKMSRSMGIHVLVPCIAAGCSLEIFGSLANITKTALSCRLADVDKDHVMLSYMLVQVPEQLTSSMPEETLRAELNKWNKDSFPRLRESAIQLSHSNKKSDRIDLCLLLGGNKLATTARKAREGFDRFRKVVESDAWEKEFAVTSKSMEEMEKAVESHDIRLDEMAR